MSNLPVSVSSPQNGEIAHSASDSVSTSRPNDEDGSSSTSVISTLRHEQNSQTAITTTSSNQDDSTAYLSNRGNSDDRVPSDDSSESASSLVSEYGSDVGEVKLRLEDIQSMAAVPEEEDDDGDENENEPIEAKSEVLEHDSDVHVGEMKSRLGESTTMPASPEEEENYESKKASSEESIQKIPRINAMQQDEMTRVTTDDSPESASSLLSEYGSDSCEMKLRLEDKISMPAAPEEEDDDDGDNEAQLEESKQQIPNNDTGFSHSEESGFMPQGAFGQDKMSRVASDDSSESASSLVSEYGSDVGEMKLRLEDSLSMPAVPEEEDGDDSEPQNDDRLNMDSYSRSEDSGFMAQAAGRQDKMPLETDSGLSYDDTVMDAISDATSFQDDWRHHSTLRDATHLNHDETPSTPIAAVSAAIRRYASGVSNMKSFAKSPTSTRVVSPQPHSSHSDPSSLRPLNLSSPKQKNMLLSPRFGITSNQKEDGRQFTFNNKLSTPLRQVTACLSFHPESCTPPYARVHDSPPSSPILRSKSWDIGGEYERNYFKRNSKRYYTGLSPASTGSAFRNNGESIIRRDGQPQRPMFSPGRRSALFPFQGQFNNHSTPNEQQLPEIPQSSSVQSKIAEHDYVALLREKDELNKRLDKELNLCRAEIGRLRSAARSEVVQLNKSIIDEDAEEDSSVESNDPKEEKEEATLLKQELLDTKAQLEATRKELNEIKMHWNNPAMKGTDETDLGDQTDEKIHVKMLDGENFETDWTHIGALGPLPEHDLHSPIVTTILSQWTEDVTTQNALLSWVEKVVQGNDPALLPPLRISNLDHQVKEGFVTHILPLLLRRSDIHVKVESRAQRRTSYDLSVTVDKLLGNGTLQADRLNSITKNTHLMAFRANGNGGIVAGDNLANTMDQDVETTSVAHSNITTHASNRATNQLQQTARVEKENVENLRSNGVSVTKEGYEKNSTPSDSAEQSSGQQQQSSMMAGAMNVFKRIGIPVSNHASSKRNPQPAVTSQPNREDGVLNDHMDEDGEQPYHRVVSAPPGKIGLTFVQYRGHAVISNVQDSSPVFGWIFPNDILIAIDEVPVSGMRVQDIVKVLTTRRDRQRALRVISSHTMKDFS